MLKNTPKPPRAPGKPKVAPKPVPLAIVKSARKPAAAVLAPAKAVSQDEVKAAKVRPEPDKEAVQTRVKDLVERVALAVGQKNKDVREVIAATLAELGKALENGEALNLPPFGKIKISRTRSLDSGSAMTLKLRRGGGGKGGQNRAKVALVDHDEAG